MNVFDCAIKIEEEAREFYEKMEAETADQEIKTLFSMLVAAEEEHLNTLRRMKVSLEPGQGQMNTLHAASCAFRPLQSKRDFLADMKNDRDFYLHAVREEEQDIKFYEDLASRTNDEPLRSKLLMLADQERKHLETIENIYSFVEEPKNYLVWGEFSNLREL